MHKVIIIGGGGHAKVVLDCLQTEGAEVLAVVDSKFEGPLLSVPRFKEYDAAWEPEAGTVVAIGDNKTRCRVAQSIKHDFVNVIHSSVVLSEHVSMGVGCMILHRSVIQAGCRIGNHVIMNSGAQIDHDCILGNYVHIAPGAVLCGNVSIGEGTLVGARSVIIPGKKIGAWSVIGAGSVVIHDIPDYSMAVGNPARVIKSIQP